MIPVSCQKQIGPSAAGAGALPGAARGRSMQLRAHPAEALRGVLGIPGDKSLSHRALLLGAMAVGESPITGLLEGEDVLATAAALSALGVDIEPGSDGRLAGARRRGGRARRAGPAARSRQLRYRGETAAGPARRAPLHRIRHRRRVATRAAHGAGDDAARADGRPVRRAQPRPAAARDHRHHRAAADPLCAAGRLGPGKVRHPAGRPARARTDHGDRAAAIARPHRAAAPSARRRGRGRGARRTARMRSA